MVQSTHIAHFSKPFSRAKNEKVITALAKAIRSSSSRFVPQDYDTNGVTYSLDSVLPVDYNTDTVAELIVKRQFNALFEKNRSAKGGLKMKDREAATFASWLEAEEQCKKTNQKFSFPLAEQDSARCALIHRVQRKISRILGPVPSLSELEFSFGPGSSIGVSRLTSVRRKLNAEPTASANAWRRIFHLRESHPHWPLEFSRINFVDGRLTFVPKTAVKDRPIVVEPLLNTYLQKGVGKFMKNRLRLFGCDLRNQDTNRDLARFGSVSDLVSTIDLSSASDLVSYNVVAELLPIDWFTLLDDLRTPRVNYQGKVYRLEKFSSMGNGFTFELESLIFFAIAQTVCNNSPFVNTFGDDIICPSKDYDAVTDALEYFGFKINKSKSFATGPFRESCGKDFWKGVNVRPVYVKDRLSYKDLFRIHNHFARGGFTDWANCIIKFIPKQLRIFGPDGFGDGHLLGNYTLRSQKDHVKAQVSIKWFKSIQFKPIPVDRPLIKDDIVVRGTVLDFDYAAVLYGTTRIQDEADAEEAFDDDPSLWSNSMYHERDRGLWKLSRIYTWAC